MPTKPKAKNGTLSPQASNPVTGVAQLPVLAAPAAHQITQAAKAGGPARSVAPAGVPALVIKPGVERWHVKTGTDSEAGEVGLNVLNGQDLGVGAVKTTVEEMLTFKRAADMPDVKKQFPKKSPYQDRRALPTEVTIWELDVTVVEAKLESDGDYHLVLKGASGSTMIGEIPDPDKKFVKNDAWRAVVAKARDAMNAKLGHALAAVDFAPAAMAPPKADRFEGGPQSVEVAAAGMTQVNAKARIRGVGFFDSNHGQTGVAKQTAIEIHPILLIEFH
jgi:hypothetical protein